MKALIHAANNLQSALKLKNIYLEQWFTCLNWPIKLYRIIDIWHGVLENLVYFMFDSSNVDMLLHFRDWRRWNCLDCLIWFKWLQICWTIGFLRPGRQREAPSFQCTKLWQRTRSKRKSRGKASVKLTCLLSKFSPSPKSYRDCK